MYDHWTLYAKLIHNVSPEELFPQETWGMRTILTIPEGENIAILTGSFGN
jgi:hypothetical protein